MDRPAEHAHLSDFVENTDQTEENRRPEWVRKTSDISQTNQLQKKG